MNDRLEIASRILPTIYQEMLNALNEPCKSLSELESKRSKLSVNKAARLALQAADALIAEEQEDILTVTRPQ